MVIQSSILINNDQRRSPILWDRDHKFSRFERDRTGKTAVNPIWTEGEKPHRKPGPLTSLKKVNPRGHLISCSAANSSPCSFVLIMRDPQFSASGASSRTRSSFGSAPDRIRRKGLVSIGSLNLNRVHFPQLAASLNLAIHRAPKREALVCLDAPLLLAAVDVSRRLASGWQTKGDDIHSPLRNNPADEFRLVLKSIGSNNHAFNEAILRTAPREMEAGQPA